MGEEEAASLPPLCFLSRPLSGQSCPDLAHGQGSTSDVSLKVGETPKRRMVGGQKLWEGWEGLGNPDLKVRQLEFSSLPSASLCVPGLITPQL